MGTRTRGILLSLLFTMAGNLGAPLADAALFTGDLLVQSQTPGRVAYRINEYSRDGALLQSITPVQAPESSDSWHTRDIVVRGDSELFAYDGTFDPYLSTYDAQSDRWSHTTHPGWATINNVSYGGIARLGDRIFATNMRVSRNQSRGIVVFDTAAQTSQEIPFPDTFSAGPIDLNVGLDGSLWTLDQGIAREFDPDSLSFLRSIPLGGGGDQRAIAIDRNGHFFVATWDGFVHHLDERGNALATLRLGTSLTDIDVAADGRLAVGTRLDGTWVIGSDFQELTQIESNRWNSFVTFVPEPNTTLLIGLGLGLLSGGRRSPSGPGGDGSGSSREPTSH